MYQALCLVEKLEHIYLDNLQIGDFCPDSRVSSLKALAIKGTVLQPVKPPTLPEMDPISQSIIHSQLMQMNINTRRGSYSSTAGGSTPSDMDHGSFTQLDSDLMMKQYQQQFSQRRHSYQPLSSYQEQQIQWLSANQPDAYLNISQNLAPPATFLKFNAMGRSFMNPLPFHEEESSPGHKRRKMSMDVLPSHMSDTNFLSDASFINRAAPESIFVDQESSQQMLNPMMMNALQPQLSNSMLPLTQTIPNDYMMTSAQSIGLKLNDEFYQLEE